MVPPYFFRDINNGVYKSGFARSQEAYDNNVTALFKALDRVSMHFRIIKNVLICEVFWLKCTRSILLPAVTSERK